MESISKYNIHGIEYVKLTELNELIRDMKQKALAGIHPDELEIPLHLVDVMPHLKRYRLLHEPKSDDDAILSLRKFMGVGDLRVVPDITHAALFRARHKGTGDIDTYVFHAWERGYNHSLKYLFIVVWSSFLYFAKWGFHWDYKYLAKEGKL